MEKTVLIFGSSGFVGSALCKKFKQSGYRVHGCDVTNINADVISTFYPHTALENNPELIFDYTYSICINCAGSASVPYSFENPFGDYELNTRIVFKILNELKKSNSRARFINLSSAAVYGNPKTLPIHETAALHPISPYGNHKLMSEIIVNQYHTYFNSEAISLRIFSAYGPGLKKQIFWDIYQKALKGKTLHMHGTGNESRDFIYIDDLAEAIYRIATHTGEIYPVYNIGNGQEISIGKIVKLFCEAYDKNLTIEFNGAGRAGDPNNWSADITRLRETGYESKYTIENGIQQLVEWLKTLK